MGTGTHGGSLTFMTIANGVMRYPARDEKGEIVKGQEQECDYYEGRLTRIELIDDEFEGHPTKKVALTMEDAQAATDWEKKVRIKFTLESWYGHGFFARFAKLDLTKPFRLGVFGSQENEKISFCYMRQSDKKIESDKTFPRHDKNAEAYRIAVDKILNNIGKPVTPPDDLPF